MGRQNAGITRFRWLSRPSRLAWALLLMLLPASAAAKGIVFLGGQIGSSFGLGETFPYREGVSLFDEQFDFSLGVHLRRQMDDALGLQLDVAYQGTKRYGYWEQRSRFRAPDYRVDHQDCVSLTVSAVVTFLKTERARYYFSMGGGIAAGDLYHFDGVFSHMIFGTGVKFPLAPGSLSAVDVGASYHKLVDRDRNGSMSAGFLNFHVGFEFVARDTRRRYRRMTGDN